MISIALINRFLVISKHYSHILMSARLSCVWGIFYYDLRSYGYDYCNHPFLTLDYLPTWKELNNAYEHRFSTSKHMLEFSLVLSGSYLVFLKFAFGYTRVGKTEDSFERMKHYFEVKSLLPWTFMTVCNLFISTLIVRQAIELQVQLQLLSSEY